MDPFIYVAAYRVLVCTLCRFGCVANEAATHLRTRHRDIPNQDRRIIIGKIRQIRDIICHQADLVEFQFPEPTAEPLPFLEPPRLDGLRCFLCPYIARHIQKIQEHCRAKHGWKNPRKRGRAAVRSNGQDGVPWATGVQCQRFFRTRAASGWFEVGRLQDIPNWMQLLDQWAAGRGLDLPAEGYANRIVADGADIFFSTVDHTTIDGRPWHDIDFPAPSAWMDQSACANANGCFGFRTISS